eukprot:6006179-Amphidinium_carterae.1
MIDNLSIEAMNNYFAIVEQLLTCFGNSWGGGRVLGRNHKPSVCVIIEVGGGMAFGTARNSASCFFLQKFVRQMSIVCLLVSSVV